jgi:hypothetical protein
MGYRPTARELEALEEITTQLAVLRPGHDTVASVLPDIHRLLETETLVLLSPILRSPSWELERLHLIGFTDAQPFEDLESGEQMPVVPEAFREEYRTLVRAHIDALTQSFSAVRVDYAMLDTSKPLDHALFRYLNSRSKTMKIR